MRLEHRVAQVPIVAHRVNGGRSPRRAECAALSGQHHRMHVRVVAQSEDRVWAGFRGLGVQGVGQVAAGPG